LNNGCVHRREFSDFSKIFSSQGSYKVPFPQNKYFVKLIKTKNCFVPSNNSFFWDCGASNPSSG